MNSSARFLVSVFLLSFASIGFSDILGSFDNTYLHPGFLDLENKEGCYSANIRQDRHNDGVERRTPSQILKSYLNNDWTFNFSLAHKFIVEVEKYQQNAFLAFCSTKLPSKISKSHNYCKTIKWRNLNPEAADELKKLVKKWRKHEALIACDLAIKKMQKVVKAARGVDFKLINHPNNFLFVEDFFTAIEAFESIKAEDADWGRSTSQVKYYKKLAKSFVSNHHIKSSTGEAANILIPKKYSDHYPNQVFFSPNQLQELKSAGEDISIFDPIESGFWRKPQINFEEYDPKTYSRMGLSSLSERLDEKQVEDLLDPDTEIAVEYVPSDKSKGETPKIKVIYGDKQKWKLKFLTDKGANAPSTMNISQAIQRIIISSETNIEPAVNNLAAAIGYTVDPTYYKKSVRMYLPKEAYEDDFDSYLEENIIQKIAGRFKPAWNVRSAFQQIKVDDDGKKYIEFKGVSLEKKSDVKTDRNVSFFVRHNLGKSFKREFRAFALFLALIADPDVKDDNTKIKLVPAKDRSGHDTFKIVFAASDMGIALGFGFPNIYPKNIISKIKHHRDGSVKDIELNYKTFFPLPLFQSVSLDDAKWLMRLVAQIPREKVYEIFRSAGYPEVVSSYYQEIFLRRCDQLYDVLGLLGQTVTGYDQRKTIVKKLSKIKDPKSFAVEGAEEFFTKGKLQDPDNKLFDASRGHFVRNWGTAISNDVEGHHKKELYKLLKKGLVLQGGNLIQRTLLENFQFSNAFIGGGHTNPFCRDKCFFSGFKAGIDWFIPMRFVVENPGDDAREHPYWVVDMFRLAFTLGAGTDGILARLALSAGPQIVGLGAEFVKGWDFIKIRPVADYAEAMDHLRNNDGATRKFLLKDINSQVLERMRPGDIFVGSSYIGSRAALSLRPNDNIVASLAFEPRAEVMHTNRVYVLKGHDNKFLTNWADIKNLNLQVAAFAEALFVRVPILQADYKKSSEKHRVFEFDFSDQEAQGELLRNINETNPDKINLKYKFKAKTVKYSGTRFKFSFFGLNKWLFTKRRSEVWGQDFILGESVHELAYERTKRHRLFKHLEPIDRNKIHIKAQMSESGNIYAKFDLNYFQNQTYKKDFLKIIRKNQAFLPKDFIVFDPESVKHYIGEFEINSSVVINSDGLKDLFSSQGPDDQAICLTIAKAHQVDGDHEEWCRKIISNHIMKLSEREVKNFIKRFRRARDLYRATHKTFTSNGVIDFNNSSVKKKAFNMLKSIVKVLRKNKDTQLVVDVLQQHIKDKNIFRKVSMTSFLEGFPGLFSTISNSDESDGGLVPNDRHMIVEVDDVFKIFTDEIDEALQGKSRSFADAN